MQPMWLCILKGRPFEETHKNTHWRKVEQMQLMWLCFISGKQFEDTHENSQWIKVKQMQPMWYFIFKNPVIGIWVQSGYTSIFRYTAGACQSDRWRSKLDRTLQIVIPNNFGQDQKGPTKWTREPRQCQGGHWQGGRQLLHTRQMPPEISKLLRSCSGPCTEFNVFIFG